MSPTNICIVGASPTLDAEQLFDLLSDPRAVEWRDKVGVVGPRDGSAKTGSRLLAVGDWVLKTNVDLAGSSGDQLRADAEAHARFAATNSLWHPRKVWAVYEAEGYWYRLSATPELSTLRQLGSTREKLRGWTSMLELCVDVARKLAIGLDLNPSNFAYDESDSRLYYIDDEWYPSLTFSELASALVSRIPEEPSIDESDWAAWGAVLFTVFEPFCSNGDQWGELWDRVASHPIAPQYEDKRLALLGGLRNAHPAYREREAKSKRRRAAGSRPSTNRTAVLADVHGNLEALDAVLGACEEYEVDSYLFVGDAVGYGPWPRQCVQRLAELPNAQYVRGNHDHAIGTGVLSSGMNRLARSCAEWTYEQLGREDRQWLLHMPLDVGGPDWIAVHGAPKDPNRFLAYVYELTYQENLTYLEASQLSLCFHGHTHVQFVHEKVPDGDCRKLGAPDRVAIGGDKTILVNPGSVGQPRDGDPRAAFAVWDRSDGAISLHRVPYDVERVVRQSHAEGLPSALSERLLAGT